MADTNKKQRKLAAKQAAKEEKALKKQQRKQSRAQVWQAFKMQAKNDKKLVPLMLLAIIGLGLVFFLIGSLFGGQWFLLPLGLVLGFALAMYIFTKRVENTVYDRAEGQAGAAGWALENLRSGPGVEWHTRTAVATNHHMDAVHRVIGPAGVVLVGEGDIKRVRPLMANYKRRLVRIAGQTPIYEIFAGEGEDQVRVRNLQKEMMKLPRNYKKKELGALSARFEAMDRDPLQAAGMPKGPVPKGASMAGMNRRARRAAQRRSK
ncbi:MULTISPECIES: DUF4191 domain-containing protein [Corynebacterium]|uniref:DUF4191 domain-containing protein n=1 Tax=Corynebacterium TaxID=1716 RepID=UPI00124C4508|nr:MULTISPECIES: DUF4191 domain-containing protein [Corynebacterium]MBV7281701.1 DUF4191 domain-containing protein [Corynebacterium sp. TAE3-ERU30]MBV7301341.1 DUF4191 domain-containing protein [Corynebacterium sp. TAE3-ERU2]